MWELERQIEELRTQVVEHEGTNIADSAFAQKVDALIAVFYEDVGEIKAINLKTLFNLFLLKTLYVNRRATSAMVLEYLSEMLFRFLWSREMAFPGANLAKSEELLTLLYQEMDARAPYQNLFETSRKLGDNALFVMGMFPAGIRRRRVGRGKRAQVIPAVNRSHYVNFGKRCYWVASQQELAEWTGQKPVLQRLSNFFEVYMDSINEMSQKYILGFDMNLIADKFLDSLNLYRKTRDPRFLENARKYASILKIDSARLPRLFGPPRARGHVL